MNRRDMLLGVTVAAAVASIPVAPALVAPIQDGKPLLSFVVGSDGESNWQWIRAIDRADALAAFMDENCGVNRCEAIADGECTEPPDDCECEWCYLYNGLDASRVKRWDARDHRNPPTPADWLKAGYTFECPCGIGPLELGDGTFICDDGTVECEFCHDKRTQRERIRAAESIPERPPGLGVVAGMATP